MSVLIPVIPESAPFTTEQRAWLNGYLAGLMAREAPSPAVTPLAATAVPTLAPLTLLFGSQTGTAENWAKRAAKEAGKRGFAATAMDMAAFDAGRLSQEKNVLVLVSTFGDGEPPDSARPLHAALSAEGALALPHLRFSVCALGDSNYSQFCQCGSEFDVRLEQLGARRVADRVDCDLGQEDKFTAWLDLALSRLAGTAAAAAPERAEVAAPKSEVEPGYHRARPFPAPVLLSRPLHAPGSSKRVHHVEFSLDDSGLIYEAGDALGVCPQNCPELVQDVLSALGADGEEAVVAPDGTSIPLRRSLTECFDLGRPTAELRALVCPELKPAEGPGPHHVVDLLLSRPRVKLSPDDFVRALKRLQPRLYSISSSPKAHPGRVHLTVGAVHYDHNDRRRKGVCSTFLADRAQPGVAPVGVFVHANPGFRPPLHRDTPMIMIGPGTGIAPFRAFLQERQATGATGKNWLFFGNQRAETDFLYREELEAFSAAKVLTRLDTAFSRDQAEKIYVQQRMIEHAAELFTWLEAGAHFYVCGDATRMAKDVDAALHAVVVRAGGRTPVQASDYVQELRTTKRYVRDVY